MRMATFKLEDGRCISISPDKVVLYEKHGVLTLSETGWDSARWVLSGTYEEAIAELNAALDHQNLHFLMVSEIEKKLSEVERRGEINESVIKGVSAWRKSTVYDSLACDESLDLLDEILAGGVLSDA